MPSFPFKTPLTELNWKPHILKFPSKRILKVPGWKNLFHVTFQGSGPSLYYLRHFTFHRAVSCRFPPPSFISSPLPSHLTHSLWLYIFHNLIIFSYVVFASSILACDVTLEYEKESRREGIVSGVRWTPSSAVHYTVLKKKDWIELPTVLEPTFFCSCDALN